VGKAGAGKDIAILGSGSLVRQLTDHGLIDEYRLTLNPVILGAGRDCSRASCPRSPSLLDEKRFGSAAYY
jgi:dihydrofolate reductase